MKKIIFTANDLNIGGIEKALIALLLNLNYKEYDVTLILEKKEGILLNEVPKQVHIKEYKVSSFKIPIIRKIINRLKLIYTVIMNYKRYDFSCCYAPYSIPGSIISRYCSKNSSIWIHSDYYYTYKEDIKRIKEFYNTVKVNKFNKIVFVANEARDNFLKIYKKLKNKTVVCNNLIDYKNIEELSKESIKEKKNNKVIFINVARHDESSKCLTRLIEAVKKLKEDNHNFEVWLIGDGPDNKLYKDITNKYNLNEYIKFIGMKENPYPYYKKADALILTSDYEGFPVVYLESLIFNLPIITTIDVSDDNLKIKDKYGIIVDKTVDDVYRGMKIFLDKGFKIKERFNIKKFNENTLRNIEKIISNREVK